MLKIIEFDNEKEYKININLYFVILNILIVIKLYNSTQMESRFSKGGSHSSQY